MLENHAVQVYALPRHTWPLRKCNTENNVETHNGMDTHLCVYKERENVNGRREEREDKREREEERVREGESERGRE